MLALAHMDAERCKSDFLALLKSGVPIDARDLSLIATELFAAGQSEVALTLINAACVALPDEEWTKQLRERAMEMGLEAAKKARSRPSAEDPAPLRGLWCWS